jgi:gluconokinase
LAHERADLMQRARYWMTLGEFFLLHWTGRRACSYSAAAWTGLLDRQKLVWDAELIAQLPITQDQLSPLVDHDTFGSLRSEYAARWPALKDAAWLPAVGDGAAANMGSGCIDASRMALTIGTSSAMRVTKPCEGSHPSQGLPRGLWSYRVTRDRELVGGALSEGGNLYGWMRSVFHLDESQIELELAALQPDAHGLTMLPFLAGERAPNWNADARGAITGISLKTEPIEILRAGLESIAYRLGLVFQLLRGMAPNAQQVVASGGALMNSPTWLQIIADTLGVPVIASAEIEATSRGTALLALKALSVIDSLDKLPAELGTTYHPDAARHEIYASAMERQKKLYNAVVEN